MSLIFSNSLKYQKWFQSSTAHFKLLYPVFQRLAFLHLKEDGLNNPNRWLNSFSINKNYRFIY